MNISLEEQIEYMREEVSNIKGGVEICRLIEPGLLRKWSSKLNNCKAILATLEEVRDEQKAEVGLCRHGVPLDWNCNACSDSLATTKPEPGP